MLCLLPRLPFLSNTTPVCISVYIITWLVYVRCESPSPFDQLANVSALSTNESVPTSIQSIVEQRNFSQETLNERQVANSSGCNSSFANVTAESNFSTLSPTTLKWSSFETDKTTDRDDQRDKENLEITSPGGFLRESHITRAPAAPSPTAGRNNSVMKVYIGGLFDLSEASPGSGGHSGRAELDSALMAIDHVNNQQFIPNVTLELLHNSTMVSTDNFYLYSLY